MESSRKRKSALDYVENKAETELRRRKLAALEEHADFSFTIGPEKEVCFRRTFLN